MSDNALFSYTNRDYESARKEGLAQIPRLSSGTWTDLNVTDPGIIILDYVHALVDMINYYQDHQALEAFIPTAKERANIFRLAKQLSYQISSAKSAQVYVTFRTDFYYDEIIKIPKHTKVSTKDSINFITVEDTYLPAGESEVTVLCKQGNLITQKYQGTGLSRYSILEDTVSENQMITLTASNIDISSIEITSKSGIWTPVDYIIYATEIDRVYQPELNPDNSITIKFGDGERGIYPAEGEELTITYLSTDAEDGRVGAGSITVTETIYHKGEYVSFIVTNKEASIGGSSPQSSTSIRELAPGAIKAQGRAVTLEDFENLAKLVDGVADAKAYDINTNSSIPFHEVRVLIIPEVNHTSNKILLDTVYNFLYQRMIPPTNLRVILPSDILVDIEVTVKKFDDIADASLQYSLDNLIRDYFDNREDSIGLDFYPTDLSTKIASLPHVKYVISMTPSTIVEIDDLARAKLGELKINIQ